MIDERLILEFGISTALLFWRYKIKHGLLSNRLFQRKNLRVNFYEKLCLPVSASNKKHLSKQVVPIAYTLEKTFFAVATSQVL